MIVPFRRGGTRREWAWACARPARGVTYVEMIVALAVLGLVLSGLGATVVTQLRLAEAAEHRAYLIVPQSATLRLDAFDARTGQFAAVCLLDESSADVVGPARRWATRLGVAVLALPDARPDRGGVSRFPIEVGPRFSLRFPGAIEAYEAAYGVELDGGLTDDGTEVGAVAVLAAVAGS
jgi:hypothetical protein